jgi:hypothetical protein
MTSARQLSSIGIACLLAVGCKGTPRPTEELARAKTLVTQAENGGAQRYAAADLDRARTKLQQAEAAAEDKDNDVARRRANESAADAELAVARTRSGDAQRAAGEMEKSVETLRQEANRGLPTDEPGSAEPQNR